MSDKTSTIRWQDPPERKAGRHLSAKWLAVADALRANPGRWALVSDDTAMSMISNINGGRVAAFAPDEEGYFVARSSRDRTVHRTGRCDMYLKYVTDQPTDDNEEN